MSSAQRRARERKERRASILDAASAVFESSGYEQATMDDIAARAQLSKGTLYLYFKSKDDLFAALATRSVAGLAEAFEEVASQSATGLEAIRQMLAQYAGNVMGEPQIFRILVGQLASGRLVDPETASFVTHRAVVERIIAALITAVDRGKNDGSIRKHVDARQLASQLWGGLLGTMLLCINGAEMARRFPQPVDYAKLADGYIHLICDGLATPGIEAQAGRQGNEVNP